ncbi:regulator of chromosome condensation 1/beta-lactamase-inhibitor protein II [Irpex rosettiformis]|uniref:Regulator of chromosome condensation 1/beta-lactamase-inhibitor protein II n=1 Tax=Irpex rosettiformis TaxID=378272 RepID=A0ACB8UBK8_9APHY|nr:regulator of chromosome condensation 1/beta-lactamase-inhibitor protein II [Irpex rosettiformis]
MSKFESLPVEVIIDNILPFLPVSAVANLSATNKFFYLVTSDETFWRRRLLVDYNFSGNDTARTTGWKFIYRRLANPKVYVWGENSKRRLGFRPRDLPQTSVYEGVPYPVQLHLPHGVKVVSLCAGGMSFHALDSQGRIWVWGTLDGTGFFVHAENFSDRYKPAEAPTLLELPFSIRAISCGRLHAAALTTSSQVLNFPSWGRPFVLHSRYFTSSLSYLSPSADIHSSFTNPTASIIHAHSPPSVPIQVECGWGFTAVLTSSGNVFVYWPRENGRDRLGRLIYKMNRKWDEESVGMAKLEGVHGDHEDPLRTKCHVWNVDAETPNDSYRDDEGHEIQEEGVIMVKLPDLEGYDLPKLTNMKGQSGESDTDEPVKIVKIAGLDNTIVGLTNNGHVVMIRGLEGQETSQLAGNRWTYLPYFSEVEKVREDDVWTEGSNGLQPPKEMKISHISGNYKTFTAYSPHPGVVLMGNIDDDPSINHPNISNLLLHVRPFKPTVLPDLQAPHNNIISVVLGDYHFGALTSSGKLLTWGGFSKGALGLGDPNDLDVGVPGGFRNQEEKDESIRNTSLRRNGLEPDRTDVPGEVRFDWEDKKRGREGKERYCFGATAAGWHMGALVIDLSVRWIFFSPVNYGKDAYTLIN